MPYLRLALAASLLLALFTAVPVFAADQAIETTITVDDLAKLDAANTSEPNMSIQPPTVDAAATWAAGSCPASASFSCSEPCYPQRVNCIENCNGNFECVSNCMYCWRECEFYC